jgi:hypothetical protein
VRHGDAAGDHHHGSGGKDSHNHKFVLPNIVSSIDAYVDSYVGQKVSKIVAQVARSPSPPPSSRSAHTPTAPETKKTSNAAPTPRSRKAQFLLHSAISGAMAGSLTDADSMEASTVEMSKDDAHAGELKARKKGKKGFSSSAVHPESEMRSTFPTQSGEV